MLKALISDLKAIGVTPGDTLFIHSSFKSLGPVEGGAQTVVPGLERAVEPDGLILMPSFNLVESEKRAETWDLATTPSTVGWLTEYFRNLPGTVRSDHYSHSVAARGRGATEFVSGHLDREGEQSPWDKEPWGRTWGTRSPFAKAYRRGGKLFMLGVDYSSSTFVHYVEVLYWNWLLRDDPEAAYRWLDREMLGSMWDKTGRLRRGHVGDADSRLFSIRDYVDTLLAAVREGPDRWARA